MRFLAAVWAIVAGICGWLLALAAGDCNGSHVTHRQMLVLGLNPLISGELLGSWGVYDVRCFGRKGLVFQRVYSVCGALLKRCASQSPGFASLLRGASMWGGGWVKNFLSCGAAFALGLAVVGQVRLLPGGGRLEPAAERTTATTDVAGPAGKADRWAARDGCEPRPGGAGSLFPCEGEAGSCLPPKVG